MQFIVLRLFVMVQLVSPVAVVLRLFVMVTLLPVFSFSSFLVTFELEDELFSLKFECSLQCCMKRRTARTVFLSL